MEPPPAWANPNAQQSHRQQQVPTQQQQIINPHAIVQQHESELFAKYSTLDEPVMDTIMRDVHAVTTKLQLICSQRPFPYMNTMMSTNRVSSAGAVPATAAAATVTTHDTSAAADPNTPTTGSSTPAAATTTTDYTHIYWNSLSPIYNSNPYSRVATNDTATTGTAATTTSTSTVTAAPSANTAITLSSEDKYIIQQLKDWDLWGPLIICLCLAIILSMNAPQNEQSAIIFATVFTSISIGSTIITFNVQLLNGTISFFQSICVLGYSIFPLMIAACIIAVLKLIYIRWIWIHCIIVFLASVWSLRISSIFISLYIPIERRALALYPLLFYYTFLAWLIVLF